jgi:endo-1,4-beta-xylanase
VSETDLFICFGSFRTLSMGLLLLLASFVCLSIKAASVTFLAESGTLGPDWAVSNNDTPVCIYITTEDTGNNPINTNRLATYFVTFPAVGAYQLYARVFVGAGGYNSDSLFYGNGFGTQNPTNNANWILVNGLAGVGFSNATDIVTG